MGKIRRARNKLHRSVNLKEASNVTSSSLEFKPPPLNLSSENPFAGINIDIANLCNVKTDDVVSVKSFKSIKSELGGSKQLSKKEKLKMKKDLLLQKIDTVNQLKRESELRKKRKNVAIIGDTNPLRDALPDLESLLKSREGTNLKQGAVKKKAIARENKRRKSMLAHVQIYKELMKNKEFKKDPLAAISSHVKAIVESKHL